MIDPRHILVVIDPTSKSQPALQRATWLAKRTRASIELFVCDYDQYLAGGRFFDAKALAKARQSLLDNHEKRLGKLATPISAQGISVTVSAAWDRPLHDGIVRKVLKSKPDLVVKDTHYHTAIKRALFTNTDWNLIRECPAPLWLVKPRDIGADVAIIAAVDPVHDRDTPAELDHRILEAAQTLAGTLDGHLSVLHAFDPSPAFAVSADSMAFPISMPMNELMAGLKEQHGCAVDELMQGYSIPESDVHVLEGDVGELLNALIENVGADLVVMGAVSRGALQRLVLGSTAESLLDRIPCDLMIVKSSGFETSVQAG